MKAKDTVIKTHNPQILPEINQYQIALLVKQAEISFDAGIKEVVDFIESRWGSKFISNYMLIRTEDTEWRDQKKAWGLGQ